MSKPTKFYWAAEINGWKIYGIWIKQKYFVGYSITLEALGL